MALERSFVELNQASRERMQSLADHLSDSELRHPVGEHWTVGIVFAHLAFWDRRVMYVMDMTEIEGKLHIPTIDIFVNDLSLPLWAAIPPREAVRIALETADEVDRRLENYYPDYLEAMVNYSRRWVFRAFHRHEHLDEAEAALRGL